MHDLSEFNSAATLPDSQAGASLNLASLSPKLVERGVKSLLANSGCGALKKVECTAEGSSLSLHGHVHAYYQKQMAQEIASRVAGVRQITNYIRVID